MNPSETKQHIKESTHWYDRDGNPCYTIIGKNGKERATTLRDAKKEGYVPSVTTISREANKPALENWKATQILMCALTSPVQGTAETDKEYIERIFTDAQEQAKKAREKGIQIHAWIQQGFERQGLSEEAYPYFKSACEAVEKETDTLCTAWICEQSFCNDGYGGKCDMHTSEYVIDIKTTEKPLIDIKTWDEHDMQLSAYRAGLGYPDAKCGILYVNVLTKESKLIWIEEEKLVRGYQMFTKLKEYWYAKTGL